MGKQIQLTTNMRVVLHNVPLANFIFSKQLLDIGNEINNYSVD